MSLCGKWMSGSDGFMDVQMDVTWPLAMKIKGLT